MKTYKIKITTEVEAGNSEMAEERAFENLEQGKYKIEFEEK